MANADFWRHLEKDCRALAESEQRLVLDPADPRRLSAYGDYTLQNFGEFGRWHISHGFSAVFKTSFEELATRAGIALKTPSDVEPLRFWLHSLATFLSRHEEPYTESEYLAVWDPRRVAVVRSPAAASALYCTFLAKQSAGDMAVEHSTGGDKPNEASLNQAARKVSRRATCDLEVEEVRRRAKQLLAEGASHHDVCRHLANAPRPERTAWKHLSWDKAYMERRFRASVCKWLSKNCRP